MGTNTTNYNLYKPTIGGDADSWGDESPGEGLNENFNLIDTQMKVNADAAAAAQSDATQGIADAATADGKAVAAQATADAAVKVAGDTMTGTLTTTHVNINQDITGGDSASIAMLDNGVTRAQFGVRGYNLDALEIRAPNTAENDSYSTFVADEVDGITLGIKDTGNASTTVGRFISDDTTLTLDNEVVTKKKGDARYSPLETNINGLFAGSTGAIIGGSGFSVVRNSIGLYTVTLTAARATANYTVLLTYSDTTRYYAFIDSTHTRTTTEFRVSTLNVNGNASDMAEVAFFVVG